MAKLLKHFGIWKKRFATEYACSRLSQSKCRNIALVRLIERSKALADIYYIFCVADGRIHFTVPNLFSASLCLRGAGKDSGWFFVSVEFLINVGGDLTGLQGILLDLAAVE